MHRRSQVEQSVSCALPSTGALRFAGTLPFTGAVLSTGALSLAGTLLLFGALPLVQQVARLPLRPGRAPCSLSSRGAWIATAHVPASPLCARCFRSSPTVIHSMAPS
jgi:hypothetical protein